MPRLFHRDVVENEEDKRKEEKQAAKKPTAFKRPAPHPAKASRRRAVRIEQLTTKGQWDRSFYPRKATLMHKAVELEIASGARVGSSSSNSSSIVSA